MIKQASDWIDSLSGDVFWGTLLIIVVVILIFEYRKIGRRYTRTSKKAFGRTEGGQISAISKKT